MDARRLAAVDLHGSSGSNSRRRVVTVEFVLGSVALIGFGCWLASHSTGLGMFVGALWVLSLALNYVVLAVHALRFRDPKRLAEELAGVDVHAELRRYAVLQMWVFVPLALPAFEVARSRARV